MKSLDLDLGYGQIAVFHAGLDSPFNDWTHRHINQGFAWRPGSVSFCTLEQSGAIKVTVQEASPA